jgi:hypothetical protein
VSLDFVGRSPPEAMSGEAAFSALVMVVFLLVVFGLPIFACGAIIGGIVAPFAQERCRTGSKRLVLSCGMLGGGLAILLAAAEFFVEPFFDGEQPELEYWSYWGRGHFMDSMVSLLFHFFKHRGLPSFICGAIIGVFVARFTRRRILGGSKAGNPVD